MTEDSKKNQHGPTIYPDGALCCTGHPHLGLGLCASCYQLRAAHLRGAATTQVERLERAIQIANGHADRKREVARARAVARKNKNSKKRKVAAGWRWASIKSRYGIDQQGYENLLKSQGGGCAICGISAEEKQLYVDHCHATGRVRGILCPKCNTAVGYIETCPPETVGKILAYAVSG
jgi:hypothetical protein